jgi:hypothetical protein
MKITRILAGVLLSGSLAATGLGLAAVTAQADPIGGPHHWCPGQPTAITYDLTGGPGDGVQWDWSVCHTWYWVTVPEGNVPIRNPRGVIVPNGNIWDGDNPPRACIHDLLGLPINC